MMLIHWKRPGQDAPGVWALCEAASAEEAAEAVKNSIPTYEGQIDGVVLNYNGEDDLDTLQTAVADAVRSARQLEAPFDVLVKIGKDFAAAWRFPATAH